MLEFLKMMMGPTEEVGRTEVNNFIISTVKTPDEGYETAIMGDDVVPIKRYKDREEAEIGHHDTCRFIYKHGKRPIELKKLKWLNDLVKESDVVIEPMSDDLLRETKNMKDADLFLFVEDEA